MLLSPAYVNLPSLSTFTWASFLCLLPSQVFRSFACVCSKPFLKPHFVPVLFQEAFCAFVLYYFFYEYFTVLWSFWWRFDSFLAYILLLWFTIKSFYDILTFSCLPFSIMAYGVVFLLLILLKLYFYLVSFFNNFRSHFGIFFEVFCIW